MLAGKYDITIEAGSTFTLSLTYVGEDGAGVDLSGYSARMQLRSSVSSSTVVLELSTANSRIAIDTANSQIVLAIASADTENLTGTGVYDLELFNGALVERLIEGSYTVIAQVTR